MANMKISDLEELEATPDNADLLEIVDMAPTPTSKKITWANIKAAVLTAVGKVNEAVGFTLSGGTTSKTLTVSADMTLNGYSGTTKALAGTDTASAMTPADVKYVLGHDYTYPIQEIVEYSRAQNCPTLLVEAFLATPSSANLRAAVSDETGSGALVFATSPTLVTPALGTPASGDLRNCTGPTATTKGAVELDTDAEAVTGEDTERALTAANLKAVLGHDYTYPIQEIIEYSEAQ